MSKLLMIINTVIIMVLVFVCSIITSAIFPNLDMLFVAIIGSVVGGCISFPIMLLINKKRTPVLSKKIYAAKRKYEEHKENDNGTDDRQ